MLDTVGYVAQVIVNRGPVTSSMATSGWRRRCPTAQPSIPVLYVDLSEDEERLVLA